jgi:osmotically-inducible protein OsmY
MSKTAVAVVFSSVAILTVALLGGCSSKPIDDAAITKAVKSRLAVQFKPLEDWQVRQFDRGADQQSVTYISVNSVNGVVTLTGEVRGKKAKVKAGEIARKVEHVVRVNNQLAISPGYSDDAAGDSDKP